MPPKPERLIASCPVGPPLLVWKAMSASGPPTIDAVLPLAPGNAAIEPRTYGSRRVPSTLNFIQSSEVFVPRIRPVGASLVVTTAVELNWRGTGDWLFGTLAGVAVRQAVHAGLVT